jgi:CRISPR/Cas system-associated exonuclease Cas4 (RecB family)
MEEPGVDELADEFSDAWRRELAGDLPVLLDGNDNPDGLQDRGVAMARAFHRDAPRPNRVLAVEEAFSIDVLDPDTAEVLPRFVGRLDSLVVDADRRTRLLEHKTAARRYSESRLAHDLQPTAYSLALSTMGIEATVTFQVLLKSKAPTLVLYDLERSRQDHHDLVQTLIGVHRSILAGAFYPVRDWWCRGCQYAGPCLAG